MYTNRYVQLSQYCPAVNSSGIGKMTWLTALCMMPHFGDLFIVNRDVINDFVRRRAELDRKKNSLLSYFFYINRQI